MNKNIRSDELLPGQMFFVSQTAESKVAYRFFIIACEGSNVLYLQIRDNAAVEFVQLRHVVTFIIRNWYTQVI